MNLNFSAPINQLGYGIAGLNLAMALPEFFGRVALWPIGPVSAPQDAARVLSEEKANSVLFDADAPSLRLYHQFDLAQHIGRGPRVGMPIFELDRFKEVELHHLRAQDALIVCSEWAKVVCEDHGLKNIFVAPLGVDRSIFAPAPKRDGPYTFINVGKWEYRKGHDVIKTAFEKAFSGSDDVRLVMHCHNPCFRDKDRMLEYNREWERYYESSSLSSKIVVSHERLAGQSQLADLLRNSDCGVFPSRAEGWNLEILEMMSLGKQVITTLFSAHSEFCTEENSLLVKISGREPARDGVWFDDSPATWGDRTPGSWASLGRDEEDQLVEHMRRAYKERATNNNGIATAERYSWKNSAQKINQALEA